MARSVQLVAGAVPEPGTGILRPFPSAELPHIDPFVFLDTGEPMNLGTNDIYVGPHPHRGVQPVGILFRGRIDHRDSLGHALTVHSGGMQWLVSGAGALHEEVLQGDADGVFHMAQLWVNVPADRKMLPPEHHAVDGADVPVLTDLGEGATFRLYAGSVGEVTGPAPMPTPVVVGHLILNPGGSATLPAPSGCNAALTVVAGTAEVAGRSLGPGDTPVFDTDGDEVAVSSDGGGELLVMLGEPIGEPIAMGGGFVMNTAAEIDDAFADLRTGSFGTLEPSR